MTASQQWKVVFGFVALLAAGIFSAAHFMKDDLTGVGEGTRAPGFAAKTVDVTPAMKTLTDYRGQVVILNLWATYCVPCRTEMPSLEALHNSFASQGLRVVAVSIDQSGFEQQIRDFVSDYKLTFDVLYDDTGAIQSIYRTTGVPETFIIGRDGVIRKRILGADDWNSESNRAFIAQLVAEKAP